MSPLLWVCPTLLLVTLSVNKSKTRQSLDARLAKLDFVACYTARGVSSECLQLFSAQVHTVILKLQAQAIVAKGDLLPDEMILEVISAALLSFHISFLSARPVPNLYCLQLLEKRLQDGQAQGELGVLLDGFPRTRRQAQMLALIADTQLAVNLSLRPEVIAGDVAVPLALM